MELDLDLSENSNTKVSPKYTEDFENFVQYRRLICSITNKGRCYQSTREQKIEVGHSEGPYGTTKHYKTEQVPVTVFDNKWECIDCGKRYSDYSNGSPPYITIYQEGNNRIMYIKSGITTSPFCSKALRDLDMSNVGGLCLEGIWKAARELDIKNGYKPEADITYTVKYISNDCTIF